MPMTSREMITHLTGDDQTPIKKRFCYYQPERLSCKAEEHRYS